MTIEERDRNVLTGPIGAEGHVRPVGGREIAQARVLVRK